ncbi:hypothetical protein B0H63DRAFT_470807 [Podospora didyma]|uniref:Protein kinase domain-containing protein n=1 Tax=Podospora didyma TaxID=330526 RepID=A0AAE0NU58_9PEZI|nr:hypothetical protein B0H63DRAFT_470807 [Podospora didyma]
MAEEHLNTAFGAFGALDAVARRCMEGFAFFQRLTNAPESVDDFRIRLDLQQAKLAVWVQEWGIGSGGQHLKDRRFQAHEAAVSKHLDLIYRITNDLRSIDVNIPAPSRAPNSIPMDTLPRFHRLGLGNPFGLKSPTTNLLDPEAANSASSNSSLTTTESLKWAWHDEKSNERLHNLADLIRDLYDFLPPPYLDPAGIVVMGTSLASSDSKTLARVGKALDLDQEPLLAGLAQMKSIGYRTQASIRSAQLHASQLLPLRQGEKFLRFMATYEGSLVFVEQKHSTVSPKFQNQRAVLRARIENIVLRLQDSRIPAELRTLPCRGIVVDELVNDDSTITSTYSIVYRTESPRFFSLRQIFSQQGKSKQEIQQAKDRLSLGRRFLIAKALSRAVIYLHNADWLHKAIRSENILFFVETMADLASALPYLVGFEYSRPDALGEQTEHMTQKEEHKFYRHPKALAVPVADLNQPLGGGGTYSKVFDIYSFGVVLVELGLFISARGIVETYMGSKANPTSEEIRNLLLEKAIPKLRFLTGEIYANAARVCLDGHFDQFGRESQALHTAFYNNCVRQLDLCRA